MKRKKQLSNSRTTQPSWIIYGTIKDQSMTKLVLGTIRKNKVASGTPFTNMRKDYPPQKEKSAITNKIQTMNFVRGIYKGKKQETYQKEYFSCHNRLEYGNTFNGFCFSCKNIFHKSLECKSPEKKNSGRSNNLMRCWRCNYVGHAKTFFQTMRCYNYDRFGIKSQDYKKLRRQPMKIIHTIF
jgi:hypothetical protein